MPDELFNLVFPLPMLRTHFGQLVIPFLLIYLLIAPGALLPVASVLLLLNCIA